MAKIEDNLKHIMIEAVCAACEAIENTKKHLEIITKPDGSPVTNSDLAAQNALNQILSQVTHIPLFSEENNNTLPPPTQGLWFLADPLDGTKGFIRGKSDYTVNLALMHNTHPIAGIIAAPALNALHGSFGEGLKTSSIIKNPKDLKSVVIPNQTNGHSKPTLLLSHSEENQNVFHLLNRTFENIIHMSSALKFVMIAQGKAQVYARTHPCMLWDIGAGIALVEASGGTYRAYDKYEQNPWYSPKFAVFSKNDHPS